MGLVRRIIRFDYWLIMPLVSPSDLRAEGTKGSYNTIPIYRMEYSSELFYLTYPLCKDSAERIIKSSPMILRNL